MNRNRLILIGVLALIIAGFVSLYVYNLLSRTLAKAEPARAELVAAARDLAVGSKVTAADLKAVHIAQNEVPEGTYSNPADLIGRGVLVPILKNELVLNTKVAGENSGAGLPAMIPDGMRAVSVKVNDVVAVAGFVVPGTHVDVLLTGSPTTQGGETTTTTVLQNVTVLAAGQKLQQDAEGKPENVSVITLLVTPEDAQKLTLASQDGRIQLSLRNPIDTVQQTRPSVRNAALYSPGGEAPRKATHVVAKKEAPPVPTVYAVEVIKGDKRESAKF